MINFKGKNRKIKWFEARIGQWEFVCLEKPAGVVNDCLREEIKDQRNRKGQGSYLAHRRPEFYSRHHIGVREPQDLPEGIVEFRGRSSSENSLK